MYQTDFKKMILDKIDFYPILNINQSQTNFQTIVFK